MKNFIEDIKAGFDALPKMLTCAIFMGLLGVIFFGIDGFLYFFVGILGLWAVVFVLLPFFVFVLDGINHLVNPQHSKME